MRWRYILSIVGFLILLLGLTMAFPLAWDLYYGDNCTRAMLISMGITLAFGTGLHLAFRGERAEVISHRQGMAIVAVGWTAIGAFGALLFYLSGEFGSFADACFESVSGFTTTGSSIHA